VIKICWGFKALWEGRSCQCL